MVSRLEVRSGNSMVDSLAKKGMGRDVSVFAYTMYFFMLDIMLLYLGCSFFGDGGYLSISQ